jgi:hypothetical protein
MSEHDDAVELVGRVADERLLAQESQNLPAAVGGPEAMPEPSSARRRLVGIGATLTGVSLIIGVLLVIGGAVEALSNGAALAIAAITVGVVFVATHWGWVHVAEVTANSIEGRRDRAVIERRKQWLETIEPYTRYEVTTTVDDHGSIRIVRVAYRPVARGQGGFTFARELEREEVHSGDEPAATVAERAELLRREAAADTERERTNFRVAADAYENALLSHNDAAQEQAARRAASQALSEQINSHLRDPPLVE